MFDVGWSEMVVIGVVALIAIGPKELPGVLRSIGQWAGKIRRMASEFQGQFQEAMREAEMADVKKQVEEISSTVSDYKNFDPLTEAQQQIDKTWKDATAFDDKPSSSLPEPPALPPELLSSPPADTSIDTSSLPTSPSPPTDPLKTSGGGSAA
jgi:sec-independent protein translocase protein TatB